MAITDLDHLVMTCSDVEASARWYAAVLGLEVVRYGEGRTALQVGERKINLRPEGAAGWATGASSTPGDQDLCFRTDDRLEDVLARWADLGVPVVEGPVVRSGALGPIRSVYCHDPDGSLVEVCVPAAEANGAQ